MSLSKNHERLGVTYCDALIGLDLNNCCYELKRLGLVVGGSLKGRSFVSEEVLASEEGDFFLKQDGFFIRQREGQKSLLLLKYKYGFQPTQETMEYSRICKRMLSSCKTI